MGWFATLIEAGLILVLWLLHLGYAPPNNEICGYVKAKARANYHVSMDALKLKINLQT